jgi:hypothetical protein
MLSGFFLKKKPPFTGLARARELENRSSELATGGVDQPKQQKARG